MGLKSSRWSCLKACFKSYAFCFTTFWSDYLLEQAKPWTRPKKRSNDLERSKFSQQGWSFVCVQPWRRVTFELWEMLKNVSEVTLVTTNIFFLKILNFVQSFVECKVSLADGTIWCVLLCRSYGTIISYYAGFLYNCPVEREKKTGISLHLLVTPWVRGGLCWVRFYVIFHSKSWCYRLWKTVRQKRNRGPHVFILPLARPLPPSKTTMTSWKWKKMAPWRPRKEKNRTTITRTTGPT